MKSTVCIFKSCIGLKKKNAKSASKIAVKQYNIPWAIFNFIDRHNVVVIYNNTRVSNGLHDFVWFIVKWLMVTDDT